MKEDVSVKLVKYSILPLAGIALLAYLGHYFYIVDGQLDLFRLCLVFGIPFGIPYMLLVIPIGGSPAASVTILALNIVIGAVFGCVIAAFAAVRAVGYLLWWIVSKIIPRRK